MRIIGLVNGEVKYDINEKWKPTDWTWNLKRLYLKWQTQEIYIQGTNKVVWLKVTFTMQVTSSGMHPSKVDWHVIQNAQMPEKVQMLLLMGAL